MPIPSDDAVTFNYTRGGTVASGYTVHYIGLETDPGLLKLFRESEGNELPGLSEDVPIGTATDEIIVAIRDNGAFMDLRSRKGLSEILGRSHVISRRYDEKSLNSLLPRGVCRDFSLILRSK